MYAIIGANGFLGAYFIKNILDKTQDNILAVARTIPQGKFDPRITWVSCDVTVPA